MTSFLLTRSVRIEVGMHAITKARMPAANWGDMLPQPNANNEKLPITMPKPLAINDEAKSPIRFEDAFIESMAMTANLKYKP